jgi:hypothetical protein
MFTAVTVHFNTVELTTCLCSSLKKFHPDCRIVVFDNSTNRPLPKWVIDEFNIEYYDNTHEKLLQFYPTFNKSGVSIDPLIRSTNDLGSAKHALTIDWLINNLPYDDFVLFDSDVVLKKPIDFINSKYLTVGEISYKEHNEKNVRRLRLLPYCQYFNAAEIRRRNIKYFDASRIIGFDPLLTKGYDTGTSFYEDLLALNDAKLNTSIDLDNYINHYKNGSWSNSQKISCYSWLFSNRMFINTHANDILPRVFGNQMKAIISLTTWKARIHTVGMTIVHLMKQCPEYHIVLCLSTDEFSGKWSDLPADIARLNHMGLIEILWCKENIKPHKKYYYTMLKYRTVPIITVDDDQIPITNIADVLYASYLQYPHAIHAGRCHEIRYSTNGKALPYNQWRRCQTKLLRPSMNLFATGCGGVLYPPNILKLDADCLPKIRNIITADDMYLKIRENELRIPVRYVPGCRFIDMDSPNGLALQNNLGAHLNDLYIEKYL